MNTKTKFKLSYLSSLLLLNLGLTTHVMAQDNTTADADKDIEVIAVSGIRGSLIKSRDIKKDAATVVDAISAEDIGNFQIKMSLSLYNELQVLR